jgi:hypothetical protein
VGFRSALRLAVGVVILGSAGCGAPRGDAIRLSLASHPGTASDRLHDAARRLSPDTRLDVELAARTDAGAWAWRDGRIRVSLALVEALDDEQLAAALAHELAHLDERPRTGVTAITGTERHLDAEVAADRAGCALLAARGIPPRRAMIGMLLRLELTAGLDLEARILAAGASCARFADATASTRATASAR